MQPWRASNPGDGALARDVGDLVSLGFWSVVAAANASTREFVVITSRSLALAQLRSPQWSKEVVRICLRRFGSLSAARRPLPDYLIIGTKRGGTTTLWKALLQHPDVLPMWPAIENLKSPHFFDIHWKRGLRWYASHFPTECKRMAHRAKGDRKALVGDASPYYIFHPLAAERVARILPNVRLIILLRNPTERAYSHYRERRREGTEPLDFSCAIAAEERRLKGEVEKIKGQPGYYSQAHDHCSYLARGRYLEHLEPWLALFPSSSVLILRSEDLYASPENVVRQVHRFLNLSEQTPPPVAHLNSLPGPQLDPQTRSWLDKYFWRRM